MLHTRERKVQKAFHDRGRWTPAKLGGGESVFCNPPYGKGIHKWVEKAWKESTKPNTIVVMLIPARTDTRYFHDYILYRSEIRFIKNRLDFNDQGGRAPFPSILVIFRSGGGRKETNEISLI